MFGNGELNRKNMKKSRITEDELIEAIREHGVSSVEDVDLAIMEVDGNISVLSNNFSRRTIKERRSKRGVSKKE